MPNYLVVLILSVFVLLGAFYENTVERRIIQIKEELLELGNEKKMKVKEELKSTSEAITKVKVEFESTIKKLKQELESTKKNLKQELESTKTELKQELESTRKELKQELESNRKELKQELESTKKEL
ncbi:Hypothetical predicted protein [Mytilus galloprovincialis]|uniref:Uncharacterized protein n=1 Tax=Mytilus galloprovincialis TaxID=29158 RepID=A0A8B6CIB0_MYTGA|nr:Hypothetical predicted protein [Mytilus galloprovincialis]